MEKTMESFARLIKAGKVRYVGASNFLPWRLEEARWTSKAHRLPEYCSIQQRYSYVRPRIGTHSDPQVVANEELLDYCKNRELTLLAYSPLLRGAYTRPDRSFPEQYLGRDMEVRLAVLKVIAEEKNATANQVVLAWMIHSRPCIVPLVAASKPEQMRENLRALRVKLSIDDMARLNDACA